MELQAILAQLDPSVHKEKLDWKVIQANLV
jgi:hypothetical protein